MKRIISFVLCLSMLVSMLPMSVFAADVDESTPATEAVLETEASVATEAPVAETTEAVEPVEDTTAAATEVPETTAATEAPEVTTAATEEATEPAQTESEAAEPEETVAEDTYEEFTWVPDMELPSDEELFAGYAESVLYGGRATLGTAAGSMLSGNTKLAYDGFRELILEVAAGKRSSAKLTVGAGSFADYKVDFAGTSVPESIMKDLFRALLADLPYEMYWFDKTVGLGGGYGTTGGKLYITLNFKVSSHYSADGTQGTCDLDTAKTGAAAAAAAKARAIVDEYEDASDYEKLVGYKKEICSLTDYNDPAASSSYSGGYGNPWQLIWVFDGIPSTKVVCEGYSKAFQYLCDMSDFDADIVCYNVQGYLNGGAHMWNIVSINGSSYLADVTNSDSGTVGANGELFLVGGTANANGSYTFARQEFTYGSEAIALWGTGANSILTLAEENFDPDSLNVSAPEADANAAMTQEKFAAALADCGGYYLLSDTVVISSDMTLPEVHIEIQGGTILVKEGVTLTNRGGIVIQNDGSVIVDGTLYNSGWYLDVEDGGSLTVNGTLTGYDIGVYGGSLTVDGTLDINQVHVDVLNLDNITLTDVPVEKIEYVASPATADELIAALALVEQYTPWIGLPETLTLNKNVTIPAGANVAFENSTLTVASGVTLTLDDEFFVHPNSHLVVAEGGKLVSNVNLNITNHSRHDNGAVVTINGELVSNGGIWVTDGGTLNINGSAVAYGEIHAGFGGNGLMCQVNVSGVLTTYGYLNIVPGTSELNIAEGGTVTVGGMLFDDAGEPYANGSLQAGGDIAVDGTLNVSGGVTLGSELGSEMAIGTTGVLNINNDCMWFDVMEGAILSNEGTVTNNCIINDYGTILNYGTFHNNVQIRLFGTGSYDNFDGTHYGNEPVDGATAQLNDFLYDLEDGQGANLYGNVTLVEDLTIGLGEDHVFLSPGSELHVPAGVTLTINSHVRVEEAAIVVEEGGTLILNATNVDVVSQGALGCIIVEGHMVINDGGTLWLDEGASLEIYGDGVVDVKEDHSTEQVAAIHVSHFSDGGTVMVEGTLNTGGYVNVTPGGWFTLREGGTLNIMNNAEYGCGYLDVSGMAQLYGTVNQAGRMSVSNGNGTDEFVPATARIEVYGTLTGSDTSATFINPNASISVTGTMETAGEVKVENTGTLWVDGAVALNGPVTNYGNIHVNCFTAESGNSADLTIDGEVTNYGYLCVHPEGSLYVNGTLTIGQTEVEGQGFAGYLNSFGYVTVNDGGVINNYSLMDTDSTDGSGYLYIDEGGTVNVKDNVVMAVCDGGELIIDGTLNVFTDGYMEVYNAVSGSGSWINNCVVHFGVSTDEETGSESVGYSCFDGWFTQGADGVLEVELYQGEPIYVDLLPTQLQQLVYFGSDLESIRTVFANEEYIARVHIREDEVTLNGDLVVGTNGVLIVEDSLTIPENVTLTAYGPVTVRGGLNVEGMLKLYHPRGTLTVNENGTVNVTGTVFNGTSTTVHGSLVIDGSWEGYAPTSTETGIITSSGAQEQLNALLENEEATLTFDVTLTEDTVISGTLVIEEGYTLIVPKNITLTVNGLLDVRGTLNVKSGGKVINDGYLYTQGGRIDFSAGSMLVNNNEVACEGGAFIIAEDSCSGSGALCAVWLDGEIYEITGVDRSEQILVAYTCTTQDEIQQVLDLAEEFSWVLVRQRSDLTIGTDLEIPENVTFRIQPTVLEDGTVQHTTVTVPENVTLNNLGNFQVFEDASLIVDGEWAGNAPTGDGTIGGSYARLIIGVVTKVQPSFVENPDTAEQAPGLWAGAKTSISPTLNRMIDGEPMDAGTVSVSFSEGAENYAKIDQKNGLITITANSNLTSHEIITITFTAENADPCIINMHLRPKATAADVLLDGAAVTNQTILADLNRGDTGFQLAASAASADAVPENGVLPSGAPLVTWKSSSDAIATVDESGWVSFTGEKTGKVKITMTANYGVKKSAVVTFNVVALPQEIFPSEANPTVLVGGGSGTYTAKNGEGTVLKNTEVKWYLCDEHGEAVASHPYASITAAGKLSTKAVADETKAYLMAQVIGDEWSATLYEPVCVTLYPAIENVQILDPINDPINDKTKLYDIGTHGLYYQLSWKALPYVESVQSVEWKSSKPAVADIDENGLITVAGEDVSGTVTFTLTVTALNNKKITAKFIMKFGVFTTALDLAVTLPNGNPGDMNDLVVRSGESLTFTGSCVPGNVTTNGIVWSLLDKSLGSISGNGVLKTKAVTNPTELVVVAESKDGYCEPYNIHVTVLPKQVSTPNGMMDALVIQNEDIYLTKTTHTVQPGDDMWLDANGDVTWKSSNTNVARIDSNTGYLEALANGKATITATANDGSKRSATFNLTVDKLSESVEITTKKGEPFAVASGKSLDLVGTVFYSDETSDKKVNWSVDDTSIATISSSGKLAAVKGLTKAATVRVYAEAKDGKSKNFVDVQVLPQTTAIEIFGPFGADGKNMDISNTTVTWNMVNGKNLTLNAEVYPFDAMQDVTWKSSSDKVAYVSPDTGDVECRTSGTVTITATANDGSGKKATFKLAVMKTMDKDSLKLPETASIGGGKSLTLTTLDGYEIDTLATNQTLNWSMTYPDGSEVPASVATLTKGILKTKAVTAPVEVFIRAEATDGSECVAECTVTIFPVIKGVELYNVDGGVVSKKTVSASINRGYTILPDTTNVTGFGCDDDGTMDEAVSPDRAWTITYSKAGLATAEFDGQAITFYGTEAAVGQSVKITLKANDGSAKTAYFNISFTEAVSE